ncbi:hypothetical protein [Streptococcus oralis]|uniref:Uncharacterized protein n=1 Tax=Streptococcus oralis subsp. dentisani TaxID=1458253 RepID=A0A1X1J562_STROR|nr:hypothetical protein [Streptococcus oralis]ORO80486.1 hypothetical protein B7709_00335 [Streptococcus oralis subsp. dentisani]
MVLLVLGILVLLILIFKRKKKTGKKSEGNSKNKNWILIGCLSIVIPIAILTVSSPILSLMDMWGLFAHVSRTEIEQAVHRSYQNYGLTGQFELEKYEKNYTSVGGFVIHGTYSENIAGKTYQVQTRFKYYTRFSENKTYRKTDAEVDYKNYKKIYNVFPELAYLGIEVSPGTSEFLKTLDTSIKDPKLSDLKYEGIRFEFNSQSDNIYLYNEILEENQSKGQALQGMYPMDAQYLFQKEIFIPTFEFQYFVPKEKRDLLYDDYLKELEKLMKEFFANQPLPRGLYAVKIAKYQEDKLVNDSGVYYVRIENRQVVKLLQKLE